MSDDILLKSKAAVGKATKTGGEGMSKGLPIMERGRRVKRRNIITPDQCHKQEDRRVDELILCGLFFLNRLLADDMWCRYQIPLRIMNPLMATISQFVVYNIYTYVSH